MLHSKSYVPSRCRNEEILQLKSLLHVQSIIGVLLPFVSGFSLKRCLLKERVRGHESGAGGASVEVQNREPDRACKGVKQNANYRLSLAWRSQMMKSGNSSTLVELWFNSSSAGCRAKRGKPP